MNDDAGAVGTLRAYARKQASTDAVMRALVEHAQYLVPVGYALDAMATDRSRRLIVYSAEGGPPPGELWMFTDEDHSRRAAEICAAKGMAFGQYATPFDGVRAFGALDERLAKVKVNPEVDLETFVLASGAIATAVGEAGFANPAMVFTAPDCADRVRADMGGAAASLTTLDGERLFAGLLRAGVDGILFNPLGPGETCALPLDVCKRVLDAAS